MNPMMSNMNPMMGMNPMMNPMMGMGMNHAHTLSPPAQTQRSSPAAQLDRTWLYVTSNMHC